MSTERFTGEIFNTTISSLSNIVTSDSLFSSTTKIDVSSSLAPSTGQVLTATSSTAATWQTPGGGTSTINFWSFGDVKASGTSGGTFTAGAWQIRTLNTDLDTPLVGAGDVTRLGNVITIQPGTYLLRAIAPASGVRQHKARLFNITDSTVDSIGTSARVNNTSFVTSSFIEKKLVLTSSKDFRIEHRCINTRGSVGFGIATGIAGVTELYTIVSIIKLD